VGPFDGVGHAGTSETLPVWLDPGSANDAPTVGGASCFDWGLDFEWMLVIVSPRPLLRWLPPTALRLEVIILFDEDDQWKVHALDAIVSPADVGRIAFSC